MDELLLTLLGAIIGFLGAILGAVFAENIREKRELREFYSWVTYLLDTLLKEKNGMTEEERNAEVRGELATQALHYNFSRLWARIPKDDGNLEVRDLIRQFLKGGNRLDEIRKDNKFENLYQWLQKNSEYGVLLRIFNRII